MSKLFRMLSYLRYPYLVKRTIARRFELRESRKHSTRLNEYTTYSVSFTKAVEFATEAKQRNITKELDKLKSLGFMKHIHLCGEQIHGLGGPIGDDAGLLLYLMVRFLKPQIVVETGIANGFSSAFILKALDENRKGTLHSVDLHSRQGIMFPIGKELGWVVPDDLRHRWIVELGESKKVLPQILKKLTTINIFLHDSRHTYRTMMQEYTIVWPYLRNGGLLLSDDASINDAFLDFADMKKQTPILFNRIGAIRKK